MGVNIQKYVPGLQTQKIRLDEYFSIIHPQVTFNISSICKFINSQFVLKARREMMPEAWKCQPTLKLRGSNSTPTPCSLLFERMVRNERGRAFQFPEKSWIKSGARIAFRTVTFLTFLLGLIYKQYILFLQSILVWTQMDTNYISSYYTKDRR